MIFQFTSKKIISLLACISITISCLVIPASAAVTPGQVIEDNGTIATLWDIGKDAYEMWQELNPDKDPSEYSGFNPGGSFSGFGASRDDVIARYDSYVTDLQTDLGSTTLIDGGIRIYPKLYERSTSNYLTYSNVTLADGFYYALVEVSGSGIPSQSAVQTLIGSEGFVAPFYCTAKSFERITWSGITENTTYFVTETPTPINENFQAGENIAVNEFAFKFYPSTSRYKIYEVKIEYWVDIYPVQGSLLTENDISVSSRPSSIVGDYGIIGDDGTIIKYDSTKIVDETNSLVWNPVTDTSVNFTEWSYDYSDRSYNLTLEDGSTMKVVYGDENVTIEQGDTIYNVYYLTSGSEDGSGGSGGAGDDGSGGIGGAIGGLFDVLGEIIYSLIEGLINLATKALSALTGLLDLLKQFAESIIGFFGGYTDFLAAAFPFLPEETFTILNLGLILLIAAAVFKKFL